MLSCAAARTFTGSLLERRLNGGRDGEVPHKDEAKDLGRVLQARMELRFWQLSDLHPPCESKQIIKNLLDTPTQDLDTCER